MIGLKSKAPLGGMRRRIGASSHSVSHTNGRIHLAYSDTPNHDENTRTRSAMFRTVNTQLTTRNADLQSIVPLLQSQNARRQDLVLNSSKLTAFEGHLVFDGVKPVITDDGVTMADGLYRPTAICDETLSAKLNIPLAYLRRLRNEHIELWDSNVNGWLARAERTFMLRTFTGDR